MPQPDEYGSQPPLEILREILTNRELYNRDEFFQYHIEDLVVLAACQNLGAISPRTISKFSLFALPAPTDQVLNLIFNELLSNFLSIGFNENVKKYTELVVKGTVHLYQKVRSEFLPTPSRSHYAFNLRDVSRVFKGIFLTNALYLCDDQRFIRIWYHETSRVFCDRLVDDADREKAQKIIYDTAKAQFKVREPPELPILFTDISKGFGSEQRNYMEISSLDFAKQILGTFREHHSFNLSLIREVIEQSLRLIRILRQPAGHALLVGIGGIGKRTIARFAGFVAEVQVFEPMPKKDYNIIDFRNDLRALLKTAGLGTRQILFLLSDDQITDETFLEDLNNILNTGEIPGLFPQEDYEAMINELVPAARKAGENLASDALERKFVKNVITNLHIFLSLSPVGEKFGNRCRTFPSLVNCCTIIWFEPWQTASLQTVASELLQKIGSEKLGGLESSLSSLATFTHSVVFEEARNYQNQLSRIYYVTPALFIEFFTLFDKVLTQRLVRLETKKSQLIKGVEKLAETNKKVQEMEKELQELNPQLIKKAAETDALLKQLTIDQKKVTETQQVLQVEEESVSKVRKEAAALAAEAQVDLDRAMPLLQDALNAVEDLKNRKSDLAVVKSFKQPAQLIVDIMEIVCIICRKKGDWASAKAFLAQTDFFNILTDVHNHPVPEATLVKIRNMAKDPKFDIKNVMAVSESVACLFKWVTAIEKFVTESIRIAPKQKRRDESKAALQQAEATLKSKRDELKLITAKLEELQDQYTQSNNEQKELQFKITQCESRLKNASQLTTALNSEKVRWTQNIDELSDSFQTLLGDSVVVALLIAYIGPFDFSYRETILSKILQHAHSQNIIVSSSFSLESVMGNPTLFREWQIHSLPSDALSRQNGILVTNTRKWPLLIDPQSQGQNWLMDHFQLKIIRMDSGNPIKDIENGIRVGTSVLIEDLREVIDPSLQFILSPVFKVQGGRKTIQIGDKWVDYDPNFRLYLTTKLPNPKFLPETYIQLSVINFSVTKSGLTEQLLSDVVKHEKPNNEIKILSPLLKMKKHFKKQWIKFFLFYSTRKEISLIINN